MADRSFRVRGGRSGGWIALRVAACLAVAVAAGGCLTLSRGGVDGLRLPRYRPDETRRGEWYDALHPQSGPAVEVAAPVVAGTVAPAAPDADPQVLAVEPPPIPVEPTAPLRTIMGGDRLTIMIDGPEPQKFEDVVDDRGSVRLPHIGEVQAAGKTTSQVEDAIEEAYIKGLIYRYVNVTVVSLDDEFFIRGEVKREGRFALTGAMTLGKAITVAGGFTEYARRTKVEIQRGSEILPFDMDRIYSGKDEDPLLRRGDQVYVPRRFM